jgi:hypothetical protein
MAWDPTLKARPTVYDGIRMRSRLEAGYAAWLDQNGLEWEYEPCAFAGDGRPPYLPDFRLRDVPVLGRAKPATVYVEVKPPYWFWAPQFDHLDNPVRWLAERMSTIYRSEPDALVIYEVLGVEDAGRAPHVTVIGLDPEHPRRLGTSAAWSVGPAGEVGLARPLSRNDCPCPPGWWKGQN